MLNAYACMGWTFCESTSWFGVVRLFLNVGFATGHDRPHLTSVALRNNLVEQNQVPYKCLPCTTDEERTVSVLYKNLIALFLNTEYVLSHWSSEKNDSYRSIALPVQSTPLYPFEQDDEDGILAVVRTVQVSIGENFMDVEKTKG